MSEAHVTVFSDIKPTPGKDIRRGPGDTLIKQTFGEFADAQFKVLPAPDGASLINVLTGLASDEVLTSSVPINGTHEGRVVSKARLAATPGAITRCKEDWTFTDGPAWLTLDYDPPDTGPIEPEALKDALFTAWPELADGVVVHWHSASGFIFDGDRMVQGLGGQRVYLLVRDGRFVNQAGKALSRVLWSKGHGYIKVSAAGSLLTRDLFDHAMWQSGRCDYVAGARCHDGLRQVRPDPVLWANGKAVDPRSIIKRADDVADSVDLLIAQAKDAAAPEAARIREAYDQAKTRELTACAVAEGVPAADAERHAWAAVRAARGGSLLGNMTLTVIHDNGRHEVITVAHALSHRTMYHEKACLVPLNEGHRGGSPDAVLYLNQGSPIVWSFDDGGQVFRLRRQRLEVVVSKGDRAAVVDQIANALLAEDDMFISDLGLVQVVEKGLRC